MLHGYYCEEDEGEADKSDCESYPCVGVEEGDVGIGVGAGGADGDGVLVDGVLAAGLDVEAVGEVVDEGYVAGVDGVDGVVVAGGGGLGDSVDGDGEADEEQQQAGEEEEDAGADCSHEAQEGNDCEEQAEYEDVHVFRRFLLLQKREVGRARRSVAPSPFSNLRRGRRQPVGR